MIVIEHIKDGVHHSEINAAVIAIFLNNNPTEKIHFFCGDEHYKIICGLLVDHNIDTSNLIHHRLDPYDDFVRDYKLLFFDYNVVRDIFKYAIKNLEHKVVFLYTSTFLLYFIKLFCFFYKNISVTSCLHGDLERIDLKAYTNSFKKNKFFVFFYALIFGLRIPMSIHTPRNLKYIVYGESIKKNVIKIIPTLNPYIQAVPHPYLYKKIKENNILINNKINFGVIGLSSNRKNIPYLKKLIDKLMQVDNNNFNIIFSGRILDEDFYRSLLTLKFVQQNSLSTKVISNDKRNSLISCMDYSLCTYQYNSYKLIASGAFMDAINFEKPLIAINNDYISQYFYRYGNIGYLLDSYEEFEKKILDIINNFPYDEYKLQVSNIKKIKAQENIKNIIIK